MKLFDNLLEKNSTDDPLNSFFKSVLRYYVVFSIVIYSLYAIFSLVVVNVDLESIKNDIGPSILIDLLSSFQVYSDVLSNPLVLLKVSIVFFIGDLLAFTLLRFLRSVKEVYDDNQIVKHITIANLVLLFIVIAGYYFKYSSYTLVVLLLFIIILFGFVLGTFTFYLVVSHFIGESGRVYFIVLQNMLNTVNLLISFYIIFLSGFILYFISYLAVHKYIDINTLYNTVNIILLIAISIALSKD